MIAYPRWKIALVAIVVLIAIFLALPNLFGEENALQLARDRAVVQDERPDQHRAAAEVQGRHARPAPSWSRAA